jgi:hypothetical protein
MKRTPAFRGRAYDIEDNGHTIRVPVLELHDVVLLEMPEALLFANSSRGAKVRRVIYSLK